ncbi:hypothetical protein FLONG3_8301 [Fusarium longipes]|uniref:C2H2-type domain-containing protein n=1 Tax=Fusarium longipes TaxID=694270 RepID=A0A395S798_9HYPO|nr:hypothetical protein FLONG3_8301 [Fusarium longipes]
MDSNSVQERHNSSTTSPQIAQQNVNLAGLGQPRPQATNSIYPNWPGVGDDPWTPLSFGSSARSQIFGSANFQTSYQEYQDYRSKPLLSECDTNPEDSAYGSRLTHSIGNPSAYGEDLDPDVQTLDARNADTQLVNSDLESLQLQCHSATNDSRQYQDQWTRPRPPASVATAPVGGEKRWSCRECQKPCRTRSELRPVPSQGLEGVGGSAMAYLQAQEQLPGFLHPSAIFPFRGHGVDRPASQPQPGISSLSRGQVPVSIERDISSLAPVRESDENFIRPDILSGPGPLPQDRWPGPPASEEDAPGDDITASESEQHHDSVPDVMDGVQKSATLETELSSVSDNPSPQQPDVGMIDADEAQQTPRAVTLPDCSNLESSNISAESTYEILDKIPKELIASYLKKHSAGVGGETPKQDTPGGKSQSQLHKCQDCDKAFPRLCELKKHQKRHSKPYGCTFIDCSKTFGSKNDWKRHESIQHYQLERWICTCTKSNTGELCGKICHRRESFRSHLTKEHDISDPSELEEKVDTCRKGRHCDAHFWCGFCQETIEIKETENTWTKRCDHIDDHFSGRGVPKKDISEWVHEKGHEAGVAALLGAASASSSILSDPKSPQSSVPQGNCGEDRRDWKDTYMWTCQLLWLYVASPE